MTTATGSTTTLPQPDPQAAALTVVDAVDNLQRHLRAYAAIEQLVTLDHAGADTHLPGLQRDNLAMLMNVVNTGVQQCAQVARDAAVLAARPLS